MKQCSASPKNHNLNINMYSFKELLDLFQLDYSFEIQDLQRAKMMVLKMHPDKSRLPADYFLFYKKAFDIIIDYYKENSRTSAEVPKTEILYSVDTPDKNMSKTINKTIQEMGKDKFQKTFNQLFEKNMVKKPEQDHNEWFKNNDPLYQFDNISSVGGLAGAVDAIKQKNAALIKYNGVENIQSSGPSYGNLYDEEDNSSYVTCDPFSKLKFDDLRKVHKDQTVLAVSENDLSKVKTYSSMDHLQRERGSMNIQHVDRSESEKILLEREQAIKQQMLTKQHAAHLKSMEYAEKNKSVMASFLKLTN